MRVLTSLATPQKRLTTRQVSTAAESIAAAQFAMHGFDVLEHGGHTRQFYDLGVANAGGMMKLTVHGSLRGFWNLVDPYLYKGADGRTAADYHRAINRWLERQGNKVTFCLVQFELADLSRMPRIYLATAADIAARLHESVETLGDTALYEEYEVEDGEGRHTVETLPAQWRFSQQRIAELMEAPEVRAAVEFRFNDVAACSACAASESACLDCLPMMN
jgi:hypothetical protein